MVNDRAALLLRHAVAPLRPGGCLPGNTPPDEAAILGADEAVYHPSGATLLSHKMKYSNSRQDRHLLGRNNYIPDHRCVTSIHMSLRGGMPSLLQEHLPSLSTTSPT